MCAWLGRIVAFCSRAVTSQGVCTSRWCYKALDCVTGCNCSGVTTGGAATVPDMAFPARADCKEDAWCTTPCQSWLQVPIPIFLHWLSGIRAACFCHRQLVDVGYVCSVCLSIFCKFNPVCTTCHRYPMFCFYLYLLVFVSAPPVIFITFVAVCSRPLVYHPWRKRRWSKEGKSKIWQSSMPHTPDHNVSGNKPNWSGHDFY